MKTAKINDEQRAIKISAPDTVPNERLVTEPEIADNVLRNGEAARTDEPTKKKHTARNLILGLLTLTVIVLLAIYYFKAIAPFESTDDAFIEGHVTQIAPQVAGRVEKVLVVDNQFVNAGDVLVQIALGDYETKLDQQRANLASARSRLGQAQAQLTVDRAKLEQERANVIAVEAEAKRADADSKRYQAIGTSGVSESQIDLVATQARSAAAQLTVARNKTLAAESQVTLDQANIDAAAADVKNSEAAARQAELNFSYTQVTAHESGYVTRKTVEAGSYVQPGQTLLAIVPKDVWVVANFKETQLTHMRAGQSVTIKVDAYPRLKLTGYVDSIQTGAGARFSLFPPENASGNYVKVVQRVPVKIVFDGSSVSALGLALGPGMSAEPKVRVK